MDYKWCTSVHTMPPLHGGVTNGLQSVKYPHTAALSDESNTITKANTKR